MTASKKVFITASSIVAFIDRAHARHEQANAFFRYLSEEQYMLYIDIESIIRAYNDIYKEISPSLGKDFLRTIFVSDINIIYPEEGDFKAAFKTLITYRSTELTFTDALIAVIANRRGISQICTLDYLHPLFGQAVFYLPI